MYIGGFLKTFENGTVVRLGFTADRIACHTGKGYLLRQRKRNGAGNIYIGSRIFSASCTAAAGGQHHNSARQAPILRKLQREINFFIAFFSFFNIAAGKSRSSFPNDQLDGARHNACIKILLEEGVHDKQRQAGNDNGCILEQLGHFCAFSRALNIGNHTGFGLALDQDRAQHQLQGLFGGTVQ